MTEGYVLIATNDHHYLEMAVSAACSLRSNDDRPIALMIAGGMSVPKCYFGLFDHIVGFDPGPPYDGDFVRRFVLDSYTPFDRALHVDADCFLIRRDIDRFWSAFGGQQFGVMAQLQTSGKCYRDQIDVDAIVRNGIAPGVYVANWGVFFYDATDKNPIMAAAQKLIEQHESGVTPVRLSYRSRPGQWSDEPFWGIALAQSGVYVMQPNYQDALQITSPNTSEHEFDYARNTFSVTKGGIRGATGQFYHFAALNPLEAYLKATVYYRRMADLPLPAIQTAKDGMISPDNWRHCISEICPRLYDGKRVSFRFVTA